MDEEIKKDLENVAMDDEARRNFERAKKGMLLKLTREVFEEGVKDYLKTGSWRSMDDIDKWVSPEVMKYLELEKNIKQYYDERIYS